MYTLKTTTKLIRAKSDFDYGRANGLNYVATIIQFATFVEVIHLNRLWYFVLVPSAVLSTWLWGKLLRKINFRKRESNFINEENPYVMEIREAVKNKL